MEGEVKEADGKSEGEGVRKREIMREIKKEEQDGSKKQWVGHTEVISKTINLQSTG